MIMVPTAKQLARTATVVARSMSVDMATAERAVRAMAYGQLTFPAHEQAVMWAEERVNEVADNV